MLVYSGDSLLNQLKQDSRSHTSHRRRRRKRIQVESTIDSNGELRLDP
jgi:hypothetical protein